ncbi:MAG: hypothetical protein R3B93_01350 [Bacteroidia bacterium]
MFNKKGEFDLIKLQWQAIRYEDEEILSRKVKPEYQDLKEFIQEERKQGNKIFLEYLINDIELSSWLNRNFFEDEIISAVGERREPLSLYMNAAYKKIALKRLFGIKINEQDAFDAYNYWDIKNQLSKEELKAKQTSIMEGATQILEEENTDTMLYCSGCCSDRLCGYFGIRVAQTENAIVWFALLDKENLRFQFEKAQYTDVFQECINMVNNEISELGMKEMDASEEGEKWIEMEEWIDVIIEKFQIDRDTFSLTQLNEIFLKGSIQEIDAGIHLAESLGINTEIIKEDLDERYSSLSEEEKNLITWRMIDSGEYFGTLHLHYPGLARKAFLLFSK